MRTCENCKHSRLWSDEEKTDFMSNYFGPLWALPYNYQQYICEKIPKGTEYMNEKGVVCKYIGYSVGGECFDNVFHCFERKELTETTL